MRRKPPSMFFLASERCWAVKIDGRRYRLGAGRDAGAGDDGAATG